MTTLTQSMHNLEDKLVDLRALIRLGITVSEHADADAIAGMVSELNTLFWMMLDKVEACEQTKTEMLNTKYITVEGSRVQ
ncbi:hypothetical protein [Agrobacterium vitis]|uniref:hypothetical protein n=1 Tax=Agrobacterium vitis TaxID=373 RepID=UPI0012E72001|nr:hypothetical protein [Agrobacterium vitis]MVA33648.1 hypothetical protein [Agrobacterium vitis]